MHHETDLCYSFSGIAFAWSDQIDKITVLMDIDDSNEENPKVASAIDTNSKGPDGRHQWGNAAKGKEGSLEWFKLLLVDEDDLPQEVRNSEHVQQARSRLNDLKNTPEEVVSIYLEGMWEQCLAKVKAEVSQTTVDLSRFHIVITLPAICKCLAFWELKNSNLQNLYTLLTLVYSIRARLCEKSNARGC